MRGLAHGCSAPVILLCWARANAAAAVAFPALESDA